MYFVDIFKLAKNKPFIPLSCVPPLCVHIFSSYLLQYLADVEEHLGVSIPECASDMIIPLNEFDGKVVYGAKRSKSGKKKLFVMFSVNTLYIHRK